MLPAGHEDRLSPLFDAQPSDLPAAADEAPLAVALLGPRSRILAQGKIIGHILPLIATKEDLAVRKGTRSVQAVAYDEM